MNKLWEQFRGLGIGDQVMWVLVILGAALPALDVALKFAPTLETYLPRFMGSDAWRAAPLFFLFAALVLYLRKQNEGHRASLRHLTASPNLLPPRDIPKVRYRPDFEFALLPIYFQVDLTKQIPSVEVRFYAVSYLPRPILLSDLSLSLQVASLPSIEDIPLRQKDWRVEPKEEEVIVCSRQLTNAERELPWTDGRVSGCSFTLKAHAIDGQQKFAYGPVGSMAIDGWVQVPWKSRTQMAAGSDIHSEQDLIPLHNAAAKVYEALKKPPHIWTILADNEGQGDEGAILNAMAYFVAKKIPVYGRQPPESKIERLDINEQSELKFEDGGRKLHFLKFRMPPCVDLQVRLADVGALVESQRGLYAPRGERPIRAQAPAVVPLEYQRSALEQVAAHLRRSGVKLIQLQQLGRVIADPSLRDGINPIFEPLSLETTQAVVAEFIRAGKLRLKGDAIAIED